MKTNRQKTNFEKKNNKYIQEMGGFPSIKNEPMFFHRSVSPPPRSRMGFQQSLQVAMEKNNKGQGY